MCKLCWSISIVLLIALAMMSYKFIFNSAVEPAIKSTDERQALKLNPLERDLVLTEMRAFLSSVQTITEGLSKEDMPQIKKAARASGVLAQQEVPEALMNKLPLTFKKLGRDTHKKFDLLALDAEQLGDPQHTLQQLSELMSNCVACHTTYKIELE